MRANRILLIYPGSNLRNRGEELSSDPGRSLPMGLLCLAASLEQAGFEVVIHDARAVSKAETERTIVGMLEGPLLFVGISAMTVQLGHGLALVETIRERAPDIPVIWGGAHASLFPKSTAADPAADYVLRAEADQSAIVLANALRENVVDASNIAGLYHAHGPHITDVTGSDCPLPDVSELPSPAYHLLDLERYHPRRLPDGRVVRGLDVLTSRGCPYRCAFCPNELLLGRRWRKRPVDQVLAELDLLLFDGRVNHIWFMDDLFIGDKKRVVEILDHMHQRYPQVLWEANVRPDMFKEGMVDGPFLSYLKETGCASLRMGAESGNNDVLVLLKKDITVEQTVHAVAACDDAGIAPVCFFMMGIPGETQAQIFDTLQLMSHLKRRFRSAVVCGPGLFRPYPGGELYTISLEQGLREPATLAEWARELGGQGFLSSTRLPWIENPTLLEDLLFYMFYIEEFDKLDRYSIPWLRKLLARVAFSRADRRFWHLRFAASARRLVRHMRGRP